MLSDSLETVSCTPQANNSSNRAKVVWFWYPAALRLISENTRNCHETSPQIESEIKSYINFPTRFSSQKYQHFNPFCKNFSPWRYQIRVEWKTDEIFNWGTKRKTILSNNNRDVWEHSESKEDELRVDMEVIKAYLAQQRWRFGKCQMCFKLPLCIPALPCSTVYTSCHHFSCISLLQKADLWCFSVCACVRKYYDGFFSLLRFLLASMNTNVESFSWREDNE